jgi:hypothetical protein
MTNNQPTDPTPKPEWREREVIYGKSGRWMWHPTFANGKPAQIFILDTPKEGQQGECDNCEGSGAMDVSTDMGTFSTPCPKCQPLPDERESGEEKEFDDNPHGYLEDSPLWNGFIDRYRREIADLTSKLAAAEKKIEDYRDLITERANNQANEILGTFVFDHKNSRDIYISFVGEKHISVNGEKYVPESRIRELEQQHSTPATDRQEM